MFLLCVFLFVVTALVVLKIYQKLSTGICKSSAHLVGKVAIVTGANAGIGYATAKDFAERGARVILACRSEKRGKAARDSIVAATNNNDVVYKQLDLASLKSVRDFTADIIENESRLDILVNNAGAGGLGNTLTADGLQVGMQVNYFGPYLLTRLIEPLLRRSAPSRIINVTSMIHTYGEIDFENLNMEKNWSDFKVYADSKLCVVFMTVEMSRRLEGTGVVANCLHPGIVATELFKNIPNAFIRNVIDYTMNLLFKSPWEGSQTSIYLAVAQETSKMSGKYFMDCREAKPARVVYDTSLARKLWEKTECYVKL